MSAPAAPLTAEVSAVMDDIRTRKARLDEKARRLRRKQERLALDLKFLREECPHPDAYTKSLMGRDTLWRCPDCELTR
jgi:hypothetical protein